MTRPDLLDEPDDARAPGLPPARDRAVRPDADRPRAALPVTLALRLLDALDFGVLLLEPDARVRWANRPAREALVGDDLLRLEDGRIVVHGAARRRALARGLEDAVAGVRRLLCLGGGVPSVKLALVPWAAAEDGTPLLLGTLQTGEREQWPALAAYAHERRLSAGETDVLEQLVLGDRPPQIAARRGSTEGTVRSQIKALLEKTGTHSMRELVVEALHLPPMPAAGHDRPAGPARGRSRVGPPFDGHDALGSDRPPTPPRSDAGPATARAVRAPRGPRVAPFARTAPILDRRALLALRASQFAWPPAG
ncbi:MAG TPA: hypothetical protein VEA81_14655 [Burkholderiaceae bacterium]|nr:hypothetical protein [Burkholderiaceae bacterium]